MKTKNNRNWMWGLLLLLAAAGIVANQLGWLGQFSFWTIIAAGLAFVFLICCITQKTISTLPFVVAMVYIVLRNVDILPHVATWAILLAALLASIGIGLLFPQKLPKGKVAVGAFFGDCDEDDWDDEDVEQRRKKARANMGDIDNNPAVSVSFGGTSRYIHADALETVHLSCSFGGIDIFFDHAELSPNGATMHIDCKFGGIDMYIPRHWRVDNQLNCVLGGVDLNNSNLANHTPDSPQLTITGNVTLGGVDIWYI